MIRRLDRDIDTMRLETVRQPFGDKEEIEAFGLTDEIHPLYAERGGVRLAGVQHRPGITKARHAIAERWRGCSIAVEIGRAVNEGRRCLC